MKLIIKMKKINMNNNKKILNVQKVIFIANEMIILFI